MKKTLAFFFCGLMMIMSLSIGTAYAADDKNTNTPTTSEIVSELKKYETPYYEDNYDFNRDGQINVFDMVVLRKKLIAGEPGITVATAVKLELWLLGKTDSLDIINYPSTWFDPSEFRNDCIKNLTSHDFRFVRAEEASIHHSNGDISPAVGLYFIGIDEYVLESILVYDFCNSIDEFDEFVTEGTGYSIGIKNGVYSLALNSNTSKDLTPSELSIDESTEKVTSEELTGSTFILYDLTMPNLSSTEVTETIDELSNLLNEATYSFTINNDKADKFQISCKNELTELTILVYEIKPVREIPIMETDSFYLFYDNTRGFGFLEK